jgi:predicted dehydrogenase
MWCGPVQPYPFNRAIQGDGMAPGLAYRSYRDFAGGTFTCTGSHLLDLVQWGLGTDRSGPIEVWTEGEPFDSRTGRAPLVFMRYPGDITLECTQEGIYPVFIGERGSLTVSEGRLVSDPPELAQEPLAAPQFELYRSTHHWQNWLDW